MAKRGRPKKSGKRTKSGRLSRAGVEPKIVRGNERAMAMRERFGSFATEAIGRAYYEGLLGPKDDPIALERFRKGVELATEWRKHFAPHYRCALNDNPRGSANTTESHTARNAYHWMMREIEALDQAGFGSWFHQMVLAFNPDGGPAWLDRLIEGTGDFADERVLRLNIEALDYISTHRKIADTKAVDIPLHMCHGAHK